MLIRLSVVCAALALVACGQSSAPSPPGAAAVDNPDALELARIADGYYERWLELNPLAATAQGDRRHDADFGDYATQMWMADSYWLEK